MRFRVDTSPLTGFEEIQEFALRQAWEDGTSTTPLP